MVRGVDQVVRETLTSRSWRTLAAVGLATAALALAGVPVLGWLTTHPQTRSAAIEKTETRVRDYISARAGELDEHLESVDETLSLAESVNRAELFAMLSREGLEETEGLELRNSRGEPVAWWGVTFPSVACRDWCFDSSALYLVREKELQGSTELAASAVRKLPLSELSIAFADVPVIDRIRVHSQTRTDPPAGSTRFVLEEGGANGTLLVDITPSDPSLAKARIREVMFAVCLTVLALTLILIAAGVWVTRSRGRARNHAIVASALIIVARLVLLLLPVGELGSLFRFELYASRSLGLLTRSPLDLLLTTLALLSVTALWARTFESRPRRLLDLLLLGLSPIVIVTFLENLVANSRVMPTPTTVLPSSPVQWVLSVALIALGLSLARFPHSGTRLGRDDLTKVAVGATIVGALAIALVGADQTMVRAWMVAHGIWLVAFVISGRVERGALGSVVRILAVVLVLYPTLALFQREAATDFVSDTWAPLAIGEGGQHVAMIEEIVEREFSNVDLESVLSSNPRETDLTDLAWKLWVDSDLSRISIPSSLIVRDEVGNEISRYGSGAAELRWGSTITWDVPFYQNEELAGEFTIAVADPEDAMSSVGEGSGQGLLRIDEDRFASFASVLPPAVFDDVGNAANPPGFRFSRSPFWYIQNSKEGQSWWVEPASPEAVIVYLQRASNRLYAFPLALPSIGEHLRRAGSLLVTATLFLGLLYLPRLWERISVLPIRPFRSGFGARLAGTMILLAALPFLMFMLFLRVYMSDRLEAEYLQRGREALDSAQRVMEDYLESKPGERPEAVLDDEIFSWLARVVGHDLNLYREDELVASSRRELLAARFDSIRLPGDVYRATVLGGSQIFLDEREFNGSNYVEIYSPLLLSKGENWTLGLPMLVQARQITDEVDALATTLWLLLILILATALISAARAARAVSDPVDSLASAAREVGRGNLDPTLPVTRDSELGLLVDTFRDMAGSIRQQQDDLTFERDRLQTLLENIDVVVLLIGEFGRVSASNAAARQLFGDTPLLEDLAASPFGEALSAVPGNASQIEVPGEGGTRTWQVASIPLPGVDARMVLMEDVTEIVRSHRIEAWAEMARQIAHDIKNPLTPIQLTAEHLATLAEDDDPRLRSAVADGVRRILQQVDALRETSRDFNTFATTRPLEKTRHSLSSLLEGVVGPYVEVGQSRVRFVDELDGAEVLIDQRVLSGALTNLIENALQADESMVVVHGETEKEQAVITVTDHGSGVAEEDLARIFEPYFSTRSTGTGLGLAIARKAIVEHGGTITAENLHPGFRIVIHLPLTRAGE